MASSFGSRRPLNRDTLKQQARSETKQRTLKHKVFRRLSYVRSGCREAVRCILVAGGLRSEPHPDRKPLAAEAWKIKQSRSDNQRLCKRAQKERIGRRSTGSCAKGTCEAPSYEVSPREGNEETDCIKERGLVELRQPGF
jgi:hypothetical protein